MGKCQNHPVHVIEYDDVARASDPGKGRCPRHRPSHSAFLLADRSATVCVNYAAHVDAEEGLAAEIVTVGMRAIVAMEDVG